jgi:pimeloyl-ACP methyl ester carboxylesterase
MPPFTPTRIDTGETEIFVRMRGAGPPLLLLHGIPQTHLMWRALARGLASSFCIVCADPRAALWRAWGDQVDGRALEVGHFLPESSPKETAEELRAFFARDTAEVRTVLGMQH